MPKVYCVTRYRNDISPAEKWGETIELVESPLSPFATDRMAWNIAPELDKFQSEDYFLLTGPVSGFVISSIFLFDKYEQINVLRYDPFRSDYAHEIIKTIPGLKSEPSIYPPGRIFILNFIGHPIFTALEFANPEIPAKEKFATLTTGDIDQSDICGITERIVKRMADFQDGDMVLLSGPAILNPILAAVIHSYGVNAKLLLYNPKRSEYHLRNINLTHLRMTFSLAIKEGQEAVA
jgi:hypothetical protein